MLGSVMNGMIITYWFQLLDKTFGRSMRSKKTIFLKILSDQVKRRNKNQKKHDF